MKKTIIFFLATVFSTVFFAISHEIKAVDSIEKTIEITQEDYETPAMLRIKMNDLISKGYTTIRVLSKTTPNEFYTQSDIQTRLHYLRIKGVTRISDQTDYRDSLTKCKTTSTSQSCTITEKKARGASVSSTFGATYKAISASVGFNVDTNYSLSISSTQKQPLYYNGKKVKAMEMTAYPIYQRKEFKVYKFYPNYPFGNPEVYVGKGIASKPNGVEFKIVYFY